MAKPFFNIFMVDVFTDSPFKGNSTAVCILPHHKPYNWLQSMATEFHTAVTCFLTPIHAESHKFHLRWFCPHSELEIYGHSTLAAAHTLFNSDLVTSSVIEFITQWGDLTATKIQNGDGSFNVELNFPAVHTTEYNSDNNFSVSKAFNGAKIIDVKMAPPTNDLFVTHHFLPFPLLVLICDFFNSEKMLQVVLESGLQVAELQPQFDEVEKYPGRGIIVTGIASAESGFDFYSRFFCPNLGVKEDSVCGSAHCALGPYWHKKLGKSDFLAYAASARGGTVNLHFDLDNDRVLLQGKAITVMKGSVLV